MSRNPISLQEVEIHGSFMFVPQNGGPIKDAAVRNQIRQRVMQHVGRNRRKLGLNRPAPVLQYSLEVSDDFLEGSSATSSLVPSLLPQSDTEILSGDALISDTSIVAPVQELIVIGPDFQKFSFDRVGVGSLDPFAKYPFKLDHRARELMWTVQGSNTGQVQPFKVVAFRVIWIEVCMTDPAAFHQYLAGAQAYFDFLHSAQEQTFSHQVASHRACALRLINSKIANIETASSDGVIASLVLLARFYQMIGDLEKWRLHMLGLKEIIRLRGEIEKIGIHEMLRHMLSNVDISGSFASDSPPIFPIPSKLLSSSRPPAPMLEPQETYFTALWRTRLPKHGKLMDIVRDIMVENLQLRRELNRSRGRLWTETMYICHYINPLLHRLLYDSESDLSTPSSLVAEAFRLAGAVYLAAIRYAFGISPFQPEFHARKIRLLVERVEQSSKEQAVLDKWQEPGWSWVKIWILSCATIGKSAGIEGQWFLDKLHMEMSNLSLGSYGELENYIGSFLWIPEVHGVLLRDLDSRLYS